MLSDRIGRRPVILTGLTGTMISIFLFGLSKSFAWAIISRALCGLLVIFAISVQPVITSQAFIDSHLSLEWQYWRFEGKNGRGQKNFM